MRTLGIDLSSQPDKSAACLIEWTPVGATVLTIKTPLTDADILALAMNLLRSKEQDSRDAIGIDAPFGWPQPFIDLIGRTPTGTRHMPSWSPDLTRSLCYRLTDHRVREDLKLVPLSVAADKIAYPAMRCTGLLDDLGVTDRSGVNGVFEVYPAAALKAWRLPHNKFKGKDSIVKKNLADLFEMVCSRCHWLTFSKEADRLRCEHNDDAFDALIASLVTRAAALGQTTRPRDDQELARAQVEGWIAIPNKGCMIEDLRTS